VPPRDTPAGRVLFTGDHLAWSDRLRNLYAFRDACWFDWRVQTESMRRLLAHRFSWVLPGHGRRCRFDEDEMPRRLAECVAWMERR
jgi:glyoxylase-like metal-dependent hydrolase (beta-lactamase superfamily II)